MIMIKMSVTLSLLFSLSLLLPASGHDITQILNQYPDFSTFNSYLTQTNLAAAINGRQTITVLVVSNAALSSLSSTSSLDTIKNILSVHVVLDYYNVAKLQQLTSSSALLTTLFQSTGLAKGQQGFIKVTHPSASTIALESAMPGSTQASSLVSSAVAAEPYNISVIQISSPIIPQGIDGTKTSSPPTTTPTTATTTTTTTTPPPPPPPPTTASSVTATPPTSTIKAPVASTAPPKPASASSPPTKAAAAPTKAAAAPTKATATAPTKATATAPTTAAATPSATPASAPASGASVDAPAGAAAAEDPTETTPADDKPKRKSAATVVGTGLAVVCTMALSILYTTATI